MNLKRKVKVYLNTNYRKCTATGNKNSSSTLGFTIQRSTRRHRGDMILLFKMIHRIDVHDFTRMFSFSTNPHELRGNMYGGPTSFRGAKLTIFVNANLN